MYVIVGIHKKTREYGVLSMDQDFPTNKKLSIQIAEAEMFRSPENAAKMINLLSMQSNAWELKIKRLASIAEEAFRLECERKGRVAN